MGDSPPPCDNGNPVSPLSLFPNCRLGVARSHFYGRRVYQEFDGPCQVVFSDALRAMPNPDSVPNQLTAMRDHHQDTPGQLLIKLLAFPCCQWSMKRSVGGESKEIQGESFSIQSGEGSLIANEPPSDGTHVVYRTIG